MVTRLPARKAKGRSMVRQRTNLSGKASAHKAEMSGGGVRQGPKVSAGRDIWCSLPSPRPPELLHQQPTDVVIQAFQSAFPCSPASASH